MVEVLENGCTIQGLTIRDGGTASDDAGIILYTDLNLIMDCNITDNGHGIIIAGSNNTVENCTVYDNYNNGIVTAEVEVPGTPYTYGFESSSLPSGWTTYSSTYGTPMQRYSVHCPLP